MTRRKPAALGGAKSTTIAASIFTETKTTSATTETSPSVPENESIPFVPEVTRTLGGNVELELGDENVDDDAFAAMLEQYNNSVTHTTNPVAMAITPVSMGIIESRPPVIYNEPTEEAQNDSNFYSSMHDFNPFMTDDELST